MSYTKDELERIVKFCLKKLRSLDKKLLEIKVNERTITHKLAVYLQQSFPEFNVDCEYNRDECNEFDDLVKKLELPTNNVSWDDTEAKTVFPDIIVHNRGTQEKNLLVIEVKKSSSSISGKVDRNKLIAFTKDHYNYKFGLFLKINLVNENDHFEWYIGGIKIND
jgi:hypothetical protein